MSLDVDYVVEDLGKVVGGKVAGAIEERSSGGVASGFWTGDSWSISDDGDVS